MERLRDEPHIRLRYSCSAHHQDSALHPTIVQLERAAGFERGDTPEIKLHKIEALLAPTSSPIAGLPLVAELLHIPAGDLYSPSQLNPHRKKEETFELLLHQLVVLAQSQPVLLVYEDVHWIDPSSREFLDRVVDRVAEPACTVIDYIPARVSVAMDRAVTRYDARPQPPRPAPGCDARAVGRGRQSASRAHSGRDHQAQRRCATFHRGIDEGCRRSPSQSRKRRRCEHHNIAIGACRARNPPRLVDGSA